MFTTAGKAMFTATMAHPGRPCKFFIIFLSLGQQGATTIRDRIDLLSFNIIRRDETAIFQHLQSGIDRTSTWRIEATRLLFQRFHHFIPMHRPLLQQLKQGKFHIASSKETGSLTTRTKGASWAKGKRATPAVHLKETRSRSNRTMSMPLLMEVRPKSLSFST